MDIAKVLVSGAPADPETAQTTGCGWFTVVGEVLPFGCVKAVSQLGRFDRDSGIECP
jgi:hypothetical protein